MRRRNISGEIRLKTYDEIKRIRDSGIILSEIFSILEKYNLEGVNTFEIDKFIEERILYKKAKPSFKLVNDYYFSSCISVNEEVIHGVPSKNKILKKNDIIKVDIGAVLKGYFSDACRTYSIGNNEEHDKLIQAGRESLKVGIKNAFVNNSLSLLGKKIEEKTTEKGYSIFKQLTGHGVGFAVHESPVVFHYGEKNSGVRLKEGLVIAIEPVIGNGSTDIEKGGDGWTMITKDKSLSVQFEDTIAITKNGPFVLTA